MMRITIILLGLISLLSSGCTSLRPLSSKPPESAIEVKAPFKCTGFLYTVTFPAGEYRPLYEDDGGYYYQAPVKVTGRDIMTYMFDGGLYVQRGTNEPTKWYYIQPENGVKTMGHCSTLPEHTLVP